MPGRGVHDVAYFLGQSIPPAERRAKEMDFLRIYHTILIENGVRGYSFEQCFYDYRLLMLERLWQEISFVGGNMVAKEEERVYLEVLLPRISAAVIDLKER